MIKFVQKKPFFLNNFIILKKGFSAKSKPAKVEKKQEKEEEEEEEENEDEEEEEEEPKVALLERTLEVSGKRERKSTQRLEFSQTPKRKVQELEQGIYILTFILDYN